MLTLLLTAYTKYECRISNVDYCFLFTNGYACNFNTVIFCSYACSRTRKPLSKWSRSYRYLK